MGYKCGSDVVTYCRPCDHYDAANACMLLTQLSFSTHPLTDGIRNEMREVEIENEECMCVVVGSGD